MRLIYTKISRPEWDIMLCKMLSEVFLNCAAFTPSWQPLWPQCCDPLSPTIFSPSLHSNYRSLRSGSQHITRQMLH